MTLASTVAAPNSPLLRNNFGFTSGQNYDLTTPYEKKPNERVVIFLGSSPAWGFGASANENIVHQRLQTILNQRQDDVHYTVVSLAMQAWIAQQSAVALDMWGRLFKPDWVVSMNGFTDSVVGCVFSQGTIIPNNGAATKLVLLGAYQAALGRSGFEQSLLRYSAIYRRISGKKPITAQGRQYVTNDLFVDPALTKQLSLAAFVQTPLAEVRKQVQFYLLAQQSIIERFPSAKYIVTNEAQSPDFDEMFAPSSDELEKSLDSAIAHEPICGPENRELARRYVFVNEARKLETIVYSYRDHGRDISYANMGKFFPKDSKIRKGYFVDDIHLRDSGHELLAEYYASQILARDFPDRPDLQPAPRASSPAH
jgi:hypothetical protein